MSLKLDSVDHLRCRVPVFFWYFRYSHPGVKSFTKELFEIGARCVHFHTQMQSLHKCRCRQNGGALARHGFPIQFFPLTLSFSISYCFTILGGAASWHLGNSASPIIWYNECCLMRFKRCSDELGGNVPRRVFRRARRRLQAVDKKKKKKKKKSNNSSLDKEACMSAMATASILDVPETMKAVSYATYGGGAEGLEYVELPVPKPKRDQVLVKVEACSLNPLDWKVQKGFMKPVLPYRFPHVPGADIAGMVISVGPGVSTFVPGDKVVSCLGRVGGGLAEYAIAPITTTIKRRHEVTPEQGVAIGISGFAALQSVQNSAGINIDQEGSTERKNLLIRAASGGVGILAVQIAKLEGAHVTATCSPENAKLLKSLGADEVQASDDTIASSPDRKYDVIINCGPHMSFRHYKPSLARAGFVVDLNASSRGVLTTALRTLSLSKPRYFPFMHIPNSADLYHLFNLLHMGKLKVVVDSVYPLGKAREAWARCMEGHAVGKIVITCCEPLPRLPRTPRP